MTSPHTFDREEVMAYLDGELPAARAAMVSAHVETCDSCRAFVAEMRDVSGRLAAWTVEDAPGVLDVGVRSALEATPLLGRADAERSRKWWHAIVVTPAVRWAGAVGVAAAAVMGVWLTMHDEPTSSIAVQSAPPEHLARSDASTPAAVPLAEPGQGQVVAPADANQRRDREALRNPARSIEKSADSAVMRLDRVEPVPLTPPPPPPPPTEPTMTFRSASPPVPPPPPAAQTPPPPAAVVAAPPVGEIVQTASSRAEQTMNRAQQGQAVGGRGGRGGGAGAGGAGGGGDRSATASTISGLPQSSINITLDGVSTVSVSTDSFFAKVSRPLIARSADIAIGTTGFDATRKALDAIVAREKTAFVQVDIRGNAPSRVLEAELRISTERSTDVLASLRDLGRVARDTQSSENLEARAIDLLAQARKVEGEERGLQDQLVRQRGDREAVLTLEQALARARQNRERIEADLLAIQIRVAQVVVKIRLEETR